jgi:shikimate kinase
MPSVIRSTAIGALVVETGRPSVAVLVNMISMQLDLGMPGEMAPAPKL